MKAKEKFRGRFNLKMNDHLPMSLKITKLSGEPLAFHMHKNRQFVHKLQRRNEKIISIDDVKKRMEEEMRILERKGRRERIYRARGIILPEYEDSSDYNSDGRRKSV